MADMMNLGDNMPIIILSAKLVQMDGVSGVKFSYIYDSDFEPSVQDANNKGMSALESWFPDPRVWMRLDNVPGRYIGKFKLSVVKNKPQLTLYDLEYSNEVRIVDKAVYDMIGDGVPVKPEDLPFHPDAPVESKDKKGK